MAPSKNLNLHGNVPDHSDLALLIIDMLNDLEFDGGEHLLKRAIVAAENVAALKNRARALKIPAIYVNDNFGRWKSDFHSILNHCLDDGVRGEPLARLIKPDKDDYFVLKPKHSGFYSTSLDILLNYLGVKRLILTGIAGNICVFFTAYDAHMRDFIIHVPADCCASERAEDNEYALRQMKETMSVDVTCAKDLNLERFCSAETHF